MSTPKLIVTRGGDLFADEPNSEDLIIFDDIKAVRHIEPTWATYSAYGMMDPHRATSRIAALCYRLHSPEDVIIAHPSNGPTDDTYQELCRVMMMTGQLKTKNSNFAVSGTMDRKQTYVAVFIKYSTVNQGVNPQILVAPSTLERGRRALSCVMRTLFTTRCEIDYLQLVMSEDLREMLADSCKTTLQNLVLHSGVLDLVGNHGSRIGRLTISGHLSPEEARKLVSASNNVDTIQLDCGCWDIASFASIGPLMSSTIVLDQMVFAADNGGVFTDAVGPSTKRLELGDVKMEEDERNIMLKAFDLLASPDRKEVSVTFDLMGNQPDNQAGYQNEALQKLVAAAASGATKICLTGTNIGRMRRANETSELDVANIFLTLVSRLSAHPEVPQNVELWLKLELWNEELDPILHKALWAAMSGLRRRVRAEVLFSAYMSKVDKNNAMTMALSQPMNATGLYRLSLTAVCWEDNPDVPSRQLPPHVCRDVDGPIELEVRDLPVKGSRPEYYPLIQEFSGVDHLTLGFFVDDGDDDDNDDNGGAYPAVLTDLSAYIQRRTGLAKLRVEAFSTTESEACRTTFQGWLRDAVKVQRGEGLVSRDGSFTFFLAVTPPQSDNNEAVISYCGVLRDIAKTNTNLCQDLHGPDTTSKLGFELAFHEEEDEDDNINIINNNGDVVEALTNLAECSSVYNIRVPSNLVRSGWVCRTRYNRLLRMLRGLDEMKQERRLGYLIEVGESLKEEPALYDDWVSRLTRMPGFFNRLRVLVEDKKKKRRRMNA